MSNAAVEGLSGALGGVVALLATYPLMTIQTLQATRRTQREERDATLTVPFKKNRGTLADLAELVSKFGWSRLYQGLKPSLLGTTVSQGVYFYLYSIFKQAIIRREQRHGRSLRGEMGVGLSLVVAFLAGCGNVLLTNPIWVVATRMQAHEKEERQDGGGRSLSTLQVAREIVDESGVLGLWKGVLPSLVMVCNPTVNYMLYETLTTYVLDWRRSLSRTGTSKPLSALDVFGVSAVAKLGATLLTYPLLLVKARLQSAGKHTHADRRYAGTLDAVLRIWQNEGFLGFYKGMRTKIVQSILAAALLMAIKEKMTQAALVMLASPQVVEAKVSLTLPAKTQ